MTRLSAQAAADPQLTTGSLHDVDVITTDDAWAVGDYQSGGGKRTTLTAHWGGAAWEVVPSPSPAGFVGTELAAVSAASPTDVWAVGTLDRYSGGFAGVVLHWDGDAWHRVPGPASGSRVFLDDVLAVANDDVWAVGSTGPGVHHDPVAWHWDGAAWTNVPVEDPGRFFSGFTAVTGVATDDVWAVGTRYSARAGRVRPMSEHWDGQTWSRVTTPAPGPRSSSSPYAADASGTGDVWTAGNVYQSDAGDNPRSLTEHWDGDRWTVVPSPGHGPGDVDLRGIVTLGPGDVWAVGSRNFQRAVVLHRAAGRWDEMSTPLSEPADATYALGVDAAAADDVWVSGRFTGRSVQPWFLHWDGARWSAQPLTMPGA